MIGYKLFRIRKDGSLGPLFINRRLRIPLQKWMKAEDHPTRGYARRPGWHATLHPVAPHLKQKDDRIWAKVELQGVEFFERPKNQGGTWVLAKRLRVVGILMDKKSEGDSQLHVGIFQ